MNCIVSGKTLSPSSRTAVFGVILALAALGATQRSAAAETTGKGFPLRQTNAVPYATAPAPAAQQTAPPKNPTTTATTTATATSLTSSAFENAPIAFAGSESRRSRNGEGKASYSLPSIWPVLFAVGVMCLIFGGILYIMKKYIPGHRQLFNHPAMELLGRTHLDQKRYVTLLRVGRRLVVVGVCSEEMRTLTEITDESEITEIMEVARPKTEVGLTIFQRLFQRNVVEAEAEETRAIAREKVAELDAQMSTLRDRVREIRDSAEAEEKPKATRPRRQLDAVG